MFKLNKRPKKKVTVVHLGNVDTYGSLKPVVKTEKYAQRFPEVNFIGIDRLPIKPTHSNWVQLRGDFHDELMKLENNSVDIISSELALGYYSRHSDPWQGDYKNHTKTVISQAHQKLKTGGRIYIAVGPDIIDNVVDSLKKIGFNKIKVEKLRSKAKERTHYIQIFQSNATFGPVYQISAVK